MNRLIENSVTRPELPDMEVNGLLTALAEQAQHWQASLEQAQAYIRELLERADSQRCRERDGSLMVDRHQATSLIMDLLDSGAQQVSYIRPADKSILDEPETRAAIRANPGVCGRELVSRAAKVPRTMSGQNRILVRATWTTLGEIAIIDQAVALIPSPDVDGGTEIAVVQQPLLVRQLSRFFDGAWVQAACPLEPTPAHSGTEDDIKYRIIRLLAEGAKDETVARRLGISLRTCRRHVAEILDQLGSSSRFQAGVKAASLGALPARPPLPPTGRA